MQSFLLQEFASPAHLFNFFHRNGPRRIRRFLKRRFFLGGAQHRCRNGAVCFSANFLNGRLRRTQKIWGTIFDKSGVLQIVRRICAVVIDVQKRVTYGLIYNISTKNLTSVDRIWVRFCTVLQWWIMERCVNEMKHIHFSCGCTQRNEWKKEVDTKILICNIAG